ncbi:MAG: AAA family ATPase [Gammaproteobacteria bacterium]
MQKASLGAMNILVASREKEAVEAVRDILEQDGDWHITGRHISNGHVDPLYGLTEMPDALVLKVSASWSEELDAISSRDAGQRPPLVVIAEASDANAMRMAMRAGARDFLTKPVERTELIEALRRITNDTVSHQAADSDHQLVCFLNAKGGSGASLLACNVGCQMATSSGLKVALMDLDLQFGSLSAYLDLEPRSSILKAMDEVENLDDVALTGFMDRHDSGLQLLPSVPKHQPIGREIPSVRLDQLLNVACSGFDRVLVDVPRWINDATATVLERSDKVVLVLQQSIAHLRDAQRMMSLLQRELAIPANRILIVVNRYSKNAPVTVADIEESLNIKNVLLIPNDYKNVSACINYGKSLSDYASNASVTKAIGELESRLTGDVETKRPGLFRRTFGSFLGSHTA